MTQNFPKLPLNGSKMTPGVTHFFSNFFWLKSGSANFFAFRMYDLTMADPVHQNVAFVIFKHRALHSLITWILRLLLSLGKLWHIYCFWVTFTPLQMFSSFNSGSCVGFGVTGSGCFWWPVVVWTGFFWTIWGRLELVICYPHSRLKSLPQQIGVFFVLL